MKVLTAPATEPALLRQRLHDLTRRRFARSIAVSTAFFELYADRVAAACLAMAQRFQQGGRLIVFGTGAAATDAQHVSVEFVHPVLVGKRALPALALTSDVATLSAGDSESLFVRPLAVLGRDGDIAMGISTHVPDAAVARALASARGRGMLTIALTAAAVTSVDADFVFPVATEDRLIVQEVHETLYHVLWELVHVFLDAGTRLETRAPRA